MSDEAVDAEKPDEAVEPAGKDAPDKRAPDKDKEKSGEEPKGKGKKSKGKDSKDKKGKGGKAGAPASIASHPRASAQVRMAKGWGGVGGFAIALYLSLSANVSLDQAGLRALAAGVGGYIVAWACAVTVWRHLIFAELRLHAEHRRRLQDEANARAEVEKAAKKGASPAGASTPSG